MVGECACLGLSWCAKCGIVFSCGWPDRACMGPPVQCGPVHLTDRSDAHPLHSVPWAPHSQSSAGEDVDPNGDDDAVWFSLQGESTTFKGGKLSLQDIDFSSEESLDCACKSRCLVVSYCMLWFSPPKPLSCSHQHRFTRLCTSHLYEYAHTHPHTHAGHPLLVQAHVNH